MQLLKDVGAGLSKAEIVKHLQEKFGISSSAGYYHFETKGKWLKDYIDLSNSKENQFKYFTRFEYLYREASFRYMHSQEENEKLGWWSRMFDANCKLAEYGVIPELASDLAEIKRVMENRK